MILLVLLWKKNALVLVYVLIDLLLVFIFLKIQILKKLNLVQLKIILIVVILHLMFMIIKVKKYLEFLQHVVNWEYGVWDVVVHLVKKLIFKFLINQEIKYLKFIKEIKIV